MRRIGFSLQSTARDVVAGIVLLIEKRVRKGDFVTFADISGTVQDIGCAPRASSRETESRSSPRTICWSRPSCRTSRTRMSTSRARDGPRRVRGVGEPTATRRIASELRFAIVRAFAERRLPFPTPELLLRGLGNGRGHSIRRRRNLLYVSSAMEIATGPVAEITVVDGSAIKTYPAQLTSTSFHSRVSRLMVTST
jgi:hypothetical protein